MKIERTANWLLSNERPHGKVTTIVLHHDGSANDKGGLNYLVALWRAYGKGKGTKAASYHFYIGRDGTITKCVPISRRAWHCGVSTGPNGEDVNDYSIGVCLANKGNGEPYPDAQIKAALWLCNTPLYVGQPGLRYITTHRLICEPNGRKVDPAHFDFLKFWAQTKFDRWRIEGRDWNG